MKDKYFEPRGKEKSIKRLFVFNVRKLNILVGGQRLSVLGKK
jgi:hypothetical protein